MVVDNDDEASILCLQYVGLYVDSTAAVDDVCRWMDGMAVDSSAANVIQRDDQSINSPDKYKFDQINY